MNVKGLELLIKQLIKEKQMGEIEFTILMLIGPGICGFIALAQWLGGL